MDHYQIFFWNPYRGRQLSMRQEGYHMDGVRHCFDLNLHYGGYPFIDSPAVPSGLLGYDLIYQSDYQSTPPSLVLLLSVLSPSPFPIADSTGLPQRCHINARNQIIIIRITGFIQSVLLYFSGYGMVI